MAWVPGDHSCTPGEVAPCYTADGSVDTCYSNTTYRQDVLNKTATCLRAPAAAECGYTTVRAPCACPLCKPLAIYPCSCPDGQADGSLECDATGEAFAQCACERPFPYPAVPPPAAPPSPIEHGGLSAALWAAIGGGSALLVLAAVGTPLYLSRKRSQASQASMQAGLLNADSQAEAGAATSAAPYVAAAAPTAAAPVT